MIKTRFCPSPSGYIHLGNARTALFNALLAAHHGQQGCFLLRIEDTDATRSKAIYIEALQRDLTWLGTPWQEGMQCGGELGPYQQSQRHAIYDKYYQQLENQGLAYPCFCSEQQLAVSRKLQRAAGQAPRYAGTCRNLNADEVAAKRAEGLQPTLRFKMPVGQQVVFQDIVKGEQRFATDDIGDFIIRRADGTASFMYCNAIDDALMGVTHALRGEDHLTNTPRQLLILQALGLPAPQYGHISLILGQDGSPLSKRNGSRSLQDLREAGYFPLAISNYLARLGHYYAQNELMSLPELAQAFNLENLGSAPAKFDPQQLDYWQKQVMATIGEADLWQWMGDAVHALVPEQQRATFITLIRPNMVFPEDALHWAQVLFSDELIMQAEVKPVLAAMPEDFTTVAQSLLKQNGPDYEQLVTGLREQLQIKGKALFQPLRVIFTGQLHGPELKAVLPIQGTQRLLKKLNQAQRIRSEAC